MKARKLMFALAATLFAVPAIANAPPDQYDQFDRFSTSIKDAFTKLEWERRPQTSGLAFNVASLRCTSGTVFSGGRLPTVKELLTIVDEEPHEEYEAGAVVTKMVDDLAFPDTPVGLPYWTSTPAGAGKVWTVDFRTGAMTAADTATGSNHVRCVR